MNLMKLKIIFLTAKWILSLQMRAKKDAFTPFFNNFQEPINLKVSGVNRLMIINGIT